MNTIYQADLQRIRQEFEKLRAQVELIVAEANRQADFWLGKPEEESRG